MTQRFHEDGEGTEGSVKLRLCSDTLVESTEMKGTPVIHTCKLLETFMSAMALRDSEVMAIFHRHSSIGKDITHVIVYALEEEVLGVSVAETHWPHLGRGDAARSMLFFPTRVQIRSAAQGRKR